MKFTIRDIWIEYQNEFPVTETQNPEISWKLYSSGRGVRQRAYQIQVYRKWPAGNPDCDKLCSLVWDTGMVESDIMGHIRYQGERLMAETGYEVLLSVWDQEDELQTLRKGFETGLMCEERGISISWSGARWIGADEPLQVYADYLSVYQAHVHIRIGEGGTEADLIVGADDPRLMDAGQNLAQLAYHPGESYVRFTVDISDFSEKKDEAKAYVKAYRSCYAADDEAGKALYEIAIPEYLINQANCHMEHTLILKCVYGVFEIYLDGETEEHHLTKAEKPNPMPWETASWNLNPWGCGGDYIAFPNLCRIAAYEEKANTADVQIQIKNYRKPCNCLYDGKPEMGKYVDISAGTNPVLKTEFDVSKKVSFARVYATARGIYELYLNGKKVGEDYFAPGLSQYNKTHYYQVYDVSDMLERHNVFGAMLSEGWWSGSISYTGGNWNFFGDRLSLLCKLVIGYEDGTCDVVISEPETWSASADGQISYASIFQGQISNLEKPSCESLLSDGGKDTAAWKPAIEITAGKDNVFLGKAFAGMDGGTLDINYDDVKMLVQPDHGVREAARLRAVAVTEPRKGYYIYDMGQNMAGFPYICIRGKAGQKVSIRYAEMLYPDQPQFKHCKGMLMLENIRGAMAKDIFYLREGEQLLCPKFTFHGYRYLEITGVEEALPLDAVCGIAISSMTEPAASFTCSSEDITKLYQNITWSLRDNFISIPSDCPQRNERMGWSGDLSVFSRTAAYMAPCDPFLRRHMQALRDTQREDGRIADIAPIAGGFGGVLWGSAALTVPWEMYLQFGDEKILEEQYESMSRYADYLESRVDEAGFLREGPLGDWLGVENYKTEPEFLWMSYYLYDLKILKKTAEMNGDFSGMEKWEQRFKRHEAWYLDTFFDPETGETLYSSERAAMSPNNIMSRVREKTETPKRGKTGKYIMDSQASYAVPLGLGLLQGDRKKKCEANLNRSCVRKNKDETGKQKKPYSLMTGFIGTSWISQALSDGGYDSTAWGLLKQDDYPSWLYPVRQGATTIWERLNSYTREDGFGGNNSMNSFNHYSFGAVGTWMLAYAGGIRRDNAPGTFRIAPVPDEQHDITWVSASVDTVRGKYSCRWSWSAEEQCYVYDIDIPAGCEAEVELFAEKDSAVREQSQNADAGKFVSDVTRTEHKIHMKVQSGNYHFVVEKTTKQ